MTLKILFHDGCFDGAASAAVFSRFYRACIDSSVDFRALGLTHGAQDPLDERLFEGDQNAIVDFRYSPSPRLTWWFDHHSSAFASPEEEAHFHSRGGERYFHDPTAKSCTRFIARIAHERFGFAPQDPVLDELIHWAEIIDGAQFPDARTAVRLEAPALRLMLVLESNPGSALIPDIIGWMAREPLHAIVARPEVASRLEPLLTTHHDLVARVTERARLDRGVVSFDVADLVTQGLNKFIAYDLFPEARYSVSVSRTPTRAKISVGSNPWALTPRTHDLAQICEKHGGGGHPVVGAVSLPPSELARARAIAAQIVEELQTP